MIPLLLFLLACATVYLGTLQAAFSALMRLSLRLVAERSGRTAGLGPYLDEPVLFFVPSRILTGVLLGAATVLLARQTVGSGANAYALLAIGVGLFVIVFEHVIPLFIIRFFASDHERVLEALLPSFTVLVKPLRPLTLTLVKLSERRERAAGAVTPVETPGEEGEAAEAFLEAGVQEGLIEGEERKLLQSIVDFGDTLVREVMTPRPDIVAIRSDATLEELRALFREQEYSRIPVYKESLDNILGFVFVKDLIQLKNEDRPITSLMRPAYFVPMTKRVSDLLKDFQRQQVQSAIVVDEYGGTAGLVTIEDLLEEIVGEIRDEYDVESETIVDEGNGRFVFSGKVDIDEVADRLGVHIEREGFETVGGYLLAHLGRVPQVGEKFDIDGIAVEVLEAERRRVHKVRLTRLQPVRAAAGTDASDRDGGAAASEKGTGRHAAITANRTAPATAGAGDLGPGSAPVDKDRQGITRT